LEQVLAQWWSFVAFRDACIIMLHRDSHQNGQQSGYILHCCFVDCHPGGCQCDTEQAVAQWRCPVASSDALVMLHQVMRLVLRIASMHPVHLFVTTTFFAWRNCS
jgi:hypothetical protein